MASTPTFDRLYADTKKQILDDLGITYTESQSEETCRRCNGTGEYRGRNGRLFGDCYSCKGTGKRQGRVQVVIDGTITDEVAAILETKAAEAKAARKGRRDNKRTAAEAAYPILARYSGIEAAAIAGDDAAVVVFDNVRDYAKDIASKGYKYGSMSDKQTAALEKALDMAEEVGLIKYNEQAEKMAVERLAQANGTASLDAPKGRVVVTGEIVSFKHYDNDFGEVTKMLVRSDDGYKVFVTRPAAIEDASTGDRVTFRATLEPSIEDRKFAKGSRPANAEIIGN